MNRENQVQRIVWTVGQKDTSFVAKMPRLVALFLSAAGMMGVMEALPATTHRLEAAEYMAINAAQISPRTVEDYYLLLPDEYLTVRGDATTRLKAVQTRDVQNGYLKITGNWDGFTEIGLFSASDRSVVIGVSNVQFSPGVQQQLRFLAWKDGAWVDRTAEIFPVISPGRLLASYLARHPAEERGFDGEPPTWFRLPQTGTTIRAVSASEPNATELTLLELQWDNGRFVAPDMPAPLVHGSWAASSGKGDSFELTVKQDGRSLTGYWLYSAMPASMPVTGTLTGTVRDGYAEVELASTEFGKSTARAILARAGDDLYWKVTAAPRGHSLLPVATRMKPSAAVARSSGPSAGAAGTPVATSMMSASPRDQGK